MLILQCRLGDTIKINDDIDIDIVLVEVSELKASIGICAPKEVSVMRGEVKRKIVKTETPPTIRYKCRRVKAQ